MRTHAQSCCLLLVLLLLITAASAYSQNLGDRATPTPDPSQKYNGIGGGLGASIFNGKPYLLIAVRPQYEFWGTLGIGIDGNLRLNNDGKFRKEDFHDVYSIVRWINYIRFGHPGEDLYVRAGGLTNVTLGHGTIVDNYSNNSSYDNRRVGLVGRADIGVVGVEGLSSDVLVNKSLIAARGFTRPFHIFPVLANSWFFRNIQFGATASFDFDSNATRIIPNHEPFVRDFKVLNGDRLSDSLAVMRDSAHIPTPLAIYGLDAGLMIYQTRRAEGFVYGDYVKIANFNDGLVAGFRTSFLFDSVYFLDLRFEREFYRNYFIPSYYNSFYERERFNDDVAPDDFLTKTTKLADTVAGNGNGWKAGTFFDFDNKIQLGITYHHLDNLRHSDLLTMSFTFPHIWWTFYGAFDYQRRFIDGPADYIVFDDNTQASARLSVQPLKFITLTLIARWSWTRDPETDHVTRQTIIEPKASVILRL
ncbi:MAG: hypothetical protein JSS75_14595 [Bacteroidetes bacterium]|nr:hypothetical protein [Bacteroidota bacterium]